MTSVKKVPDTLSSLLDDLVRQAKPREVLAVLSSVPDAASRAERLADTLDCSVRLKKPTMIAALLAQLTVAGNDEAVTRPVADSLAGLADDMETLYGVLTRLSGRCLGAVFRGCAAAGQEVLALRLLPHLPLSRGADSPLLTLAVKHGCLSLAAALLDRRAPTEAEDAAGRTALGTACAAGQAAAVRLLLERGADPGRADSEGRTCTQRLADGGGEIAALLAAAECLGSSQSEREQSLQLHSHLCRCGFTARQVELHCEAADFLLLCIAQPLAHRACRLGGSFAEGWGICLVQANGWVADDSDVNWTLGGDIVTGTSYAEQPRYSGTLVSLDWDTGSRPASPHEVARIVQLLHRVGRQTVRQTRNLPSCYQDQERRVMRSLTTVQGQLFIVLKIIFKRLMPAIGAGGLTSYHAKTVLFFMLARHSRRRGWWLAENLLPLVRKALDLTQELLGQDSRPCVCMPHFFAEDCHLAFRSPAEDTKTRVREAIHRLRTEPAQISGLIWDLLRPVHPQRRGELQLYFHPYTLLPAEIDGAAPEPPTQEVQPRCGTSEFADAYCLVRRCLTDLISSGSSGPIDKAVCLARIGTLPTWCHCARRCLTVVTHLRFGERQRATELLLTSAKHQVQRFWNMERCFFFGDLRRPVGNDDVNGGIANCGDWAWRFCFSNIKNAPDAFLQLPEFTRSLLRPRTGDSPSRLYVNFRCVEWSLTAELLPRHMAQPAADWYAEMKLDPDYLELLTLAQYSDSSVHLQFCFGAMEELGVRLRLDLNNEMETVRSKLTRLNGESRGWNEVEIRRTNKVSTFKA